MTVKLECVYKHVVHDWKEMGVLVAKGIAALVAFVVAAALIFGAGVLIMEPAVAAIGFICQSFTAYNLFIALSTTNIVGFTLGAAYFWNKDSFTTKERAHYDASNNWIPEMTVPKSTMDVMQDNLIVETPFIVFYLFWAVWCVPDPRNLPLPPLWMVALYIVAFIIGIPIACAIARCKE